LTAATCSATTPVSSVVIMNRVPLYRDDSA